MRFVRAAVVAVGIGWLLACSGMNLGGTGGAVNGPANLDSCRKYVDSFNNAACSTIDVDPAIVCPDSLAATPCDMTAYYACMAESVKCNGEFLDVSGQNNCPSPACN